MLFTMLFTTWITRTRKKDMSILSCQEDAVGVLVCLFLSLISYFVSRMPISRSRIFLLRFPCHRIKSSIEIETQMHSAGDNWWLFRKIDILLRSQETMIVCSTKYPCSVNCTETFCWEQSWLSSKRTLCLNCLSCFETWTFVWNDDERHETVWYARSWTRRQMTTWTFSGKEIIDLMMSTLSSYPAMKQPEMKEIHVESSSS